MKINELSPAVGARVKAKRLGRGTGSGLGKTSGKGHKGQWARSGGGVRPGFEGGQNPLHRRIPKIGFKNTFKKEYNIINVDKLNVFKDGEVITLEVLVAKGIVRTPCAYGLKVLGGGELKKKLTVKAARFSLSAKSAIEKCGGTAEETV